MLEEWLRDERDPKPEINEDMRICDDSGNDWKKMIQKDIDESLKVHTLRLEAYKKKESIKIDVSVEVTHPI